MAPVEGAQEFWSQDDLVAEYAREHAALAYEVDLIGAAVQRARVGGEVETVHVLGVGAGRELDAVRTLAPGAHVVAWDISEPMVRAARRLVTERGWSDVTVLHGSLIDVRRIGGRPADVVVALGAVLGYCVTADEQLAALRTIRSSARDGAGIALVVQQRFGRPDWSAWFATHWLLGRAGVSDRTPGTRRSRHGSTSVLFHHYTRKELRSLLRAAGFDDAVVGSLRDWCRRRGLSLSPRSPNPLLAHASARA